MKRNYLSYAFLLLGLAISSCDLPDEDDWDIEFEECDTCSLRVIQGERAQLNEMESESTRQSDEDPAMKETVTTNDSSFGMAIERFESEQHRRTEP